MAFRFTLEAVLRFRETVERQEEMRLQEANRCLAEKRLEIERLDRYLQLESTCLRRYLEEGTFASELQFEILREAGLHALRQQLFEKSQLLAAARDQQRETLRKARIQREILEAVRDHQLRLHREQKQRREQRSLDDQFLLRRQFLRRDEFA